MPNGEETNEAKLKKIYSEIRSNRDKLDACPAHRFDIPPNTLFDAIANDFFNVRLTCEVCGGKMWLREADQYARGYEAAGSNPNDVIPGFKPETAEPPLKPSDIADLIFSALADPAWNPIKFRETVGNIGARLRRQTMARLPEPKRNACSCKPGSATSTCVVHGVTAKESKEARIERVRSNCTKNSAANPCAACCATCKR